MFDACKKGFLFSFSFLQPVSIWRIISESQYVLGMFLKFWQISTTLSRLRRISFRRNNWWFCRKIATKLFRHETIFNFHMNNFGMIAVKNKQNFNNNITVLLKSIQYSFANVISNWDKRIIIDLLNFLVILFHWSALNQKYKLSYVLFINWINETSKTSRNHHCVKSVRISMFSCIRNEYRKVRTKKTCVFEYFSRSSIKSEPSRRKYQNKAREQTSHWRSYLEIFLSLLVFTVYSCCDYFLWTWQMYKMKPIQATYQYYNHFLPHILSMKKYALVKSSNNNLIYKHAVNNSFQLFANTLMSKLQDLTTTVIEEIPSKVKTKKGRNLRKVDNLMIWQQALNHDRIKWA